MDMGCDAPTQDPHLTPRPVVLSVPPQVQPGPRVLKALAGEALDLNCMAEGTPEPRLTWSKDGVALHGGEPESSVHFAAIQTSDAGMYRCEASNDAGVDAWELELRVLGESLNPKTHLSLPHQQQPGLLRYWSGLWARGLLDPCLLPGPPARRCQGALVSPWVLWGRQKAPWVVIEEQGMGSSPASLTSWTTVGQSCTLSDPRFSHL